MDAGEPSVRERILRAISSNPGTHMRELERTVGVSLSGVSHHVRMLEEEGAVIGISDGHYRRYFSADLILPTEARRLTEADRRLFAECRRPMSLAIILDLAVKGGRTHAELRDHLRRSKSTVSYHLTRLTQSGVIRIASDSAERYELGDPDRTIALLVTFSATLRDHVDGLADLWGLLGRRDLDGLARP